MTFKSLISNRTIYTDLDSLFDTRFTVLLKYADDVLNYVLKQDLYDNRIIDEFHYIPSNIWKLLYNTRTVSELRTAYPTLVTGLIMQDLIVLKTDKALTNDKPNRLLVNTYPYQLTDRDLEILKKLIKTFIPTTGYFVEFTNKPPIDIDLTEVSESFYSMYMYDGINWLNDITNLGNIINTPIPHIYLHVPSLLQSAVYGNSPDDYIDIFNKTTESLSSIINLIFEPVEVFNLIKNKRHGR